MQQIRRSDRVEVDEKGNHDAIATKTEIKYCGSIFNSVKHHRHFGVNTPARNRAHIRRMDQVSPVDNSVAEILVHHSIPMTGIQIRDDLVIDERSLQWSFSRSGGPGGQNVNKVNSKATLKWTPPVDFLPPAAWHRFHSISKGYWTTEGEVVIQSQEFRDQLRNVQRCREKLAHMLRAALNPPKRRIKTRPSKSSIARRLNDKRKEADKKRARRSNESL